MSRKMYRHTRRPASRVVQGESRTIRMMEQNRIRLASIYVCFGFSFLALALRLIEVGAVGGGDLPFRRLVSDPQLMLQAEEKKSSGVVAARQGVVRRSIVDRNGMVLASSVRSASLVANPSLVRDADGVARKLSKALSGVSYKTLRAKLSKGGSKFAYLKRHMTPTEQERVNNLGVPGLYFEDHTRRVYPFGPLVSHVLGYVDVDDRGLSGVEKQFDHAMFDPLKADDPLELSLDVRVQSIVHEEVKRVMKKFEAVGAAAVVLDIEDGEVLAMASLPSFDPHKAGVAKPERKFNRVTMGAYEMGSTFKTFTMAMGLDKGIVRMDGGYDVSNPIRVAGYTINDHHNKHKWMSVPEIYAYSSNVGTVKMVMDVGKEYQQRFLHSLGMMEKVGIELPERAQPLVPSEWRDINMMTISYGHGISVTPLHLVRGIASMVNGGLREEVTLLKGGNVDKPAGERIVKEVTSHRIRTLMRNVVQYGTAKQANVPGYRVGGKTGTAEKLKNGRYAGKSKQTSLVAVFPTDQPKYLIYVMVDEPKWKARYGSATGGTVAAPAVGKIISQLAPLLGVQPVFNEPEQEESMWAAKRKRRQTVPSDNIRTRAIHAASY